MIRFSDVFTPYRICHIQKWVKAPAPAILDVGCTGNTALETRKAFPKAIYDGIDISEPSQAARSQMRNFYRMDLSLLDFSAIPDGTYDAIVLSHVVEHVHNAKDVIRGIAQKLKPGGIMYVEFPRAESIGMPSAIGTLQFCDDDTHIQIYTLADIANAMLDGGLKILDGGRRRDWRLILLSPLAIPMQIRSLIRFGKLNAAGGLYDLYGFADFVLGQKSGHPSSNPK